MSIAYVTIVIAVLIPLLPEHLRVALVIYRMISGPMSIYTIFNVLGSSTHNPIFCRGRIFTLLSGSTAQRFMAAGAPLAERRIRILPMNQHAWRPITFETKGSPYLCSQFTGDVENAVPLHVDTPRTGGSSDLPFETVLQKYLQFL
jgi:hypothetical protein